MPPSPPKPAHRIRWQSDDPGLDLYWIQAAHEWLPTELDATKRTSERTEWLQAWEALVALMVSQLRGAERSNDGGDLEGQQNDFDDWLFDRVGTVLLSLHQKEDRQRLWRPILDIGSPGHYWIQRFLKHFLSQTRHSAGTRRPQFIATWREMVKYALGSPAWRNTGEASSRNVGKMWEHLLGMSTWLPWKDDDADLIAQMDDLYGLWAKDHLPTWSESRHFIRFLRQEGTKRIRLNGLVWLADADIRRFVDDHVADDLVHVLDMSWGQERATILGDTKIKHSFLTLLELLRDNDIALQIADEIAGS